MTYLLPVAVSYTDNTRRMLEGAQMQSTQKCESLYLDLTSVYSGTVLYLLGPPRKPHSVFSLLKDDCTSHILQVFTNQDRKEMPWSAVYQHSLLYIYLPFSSGHPCQYCLGYHAHCWPNGVLISHGTPSGVPRSKDATPTVVPADCQKAF